VRRARLLVYARSKGIHADKGLIRYLSKNKEDVKELGFERVPHRTTVGRWKRHCSMMKQVFVLSMDIPFFIFIVYNFYTF
jgi:PII-like signaling protein